MIRGMPRGEMIFERWALFVTPVGGSRNGRETVNLWPFISQDGWEGEGVLNT